MPLSRTHSRVRKASENQPVEAVEKLPGVLRISPLTIACPYCAAKPRRACGTASGGRIEIVHVARLKAAAAMEAAAKEAPAISSGEAK